MAKRDSLNRGPRYRAARNRVTALVRRDKEASNLTKLTESGNSPSVRSRSRATPRRCYGR
jgi:hypothetical protein